MTIKKELTISHVDLMILSLYTSILINFSAVLSSSMNNLLLLVSLGCGYGGIALYCLGRFSSRNPALNRWNLADTWLLLVIYMLLVGVMNSLLGNGSFDQGAFLSQDLRFVMHYAIGIILALETRQEKYQRMMGKFCFVAVVLTLVGFATYDFSQAISSRTETWTLAYYCWWQISTCFMYAYAYVKFGEQKKLRYTIVVIAFTVFALLFLKRTSIIEFALLALICEFVEVKSVGKEYAVGKFLQRLFIVVLVIILILIGIRIISSINPYFSELMDVYSERFFALKEEGLNSETNSRMEEVTEYFQTAGIGKIIFGQGIYSYAPSFISTGSAVLNAFHLGLPNIIYKGGIVYLLFTIYLAVAVFKKIKYCPQMTRFEKMCLAIAIFSVFRIFFAGSWTYANGPVGYITPLFVAVSFKRRNE